MIYREMQLDEVEKLKEIDATCFIKNAWREVDGVLQLIEINWTDEELPNGLSWHMDRFRQTIVGGGTAFGCFEQDTIIGYGTINADLFGSRKQYALLDQLFVSQHMRGKGIGKTLFELCRKQAVVFGAKKVFLCAGSSENTIAFYHKIGCVNAQERNQELYEEDPRDIQMEKDAL